MFKKVGAQKSWRSGRPYRSVPKPKPNTCLVLVLVHSPDLSVPNTIPKYFAFGTFWKWTKQGTLFGTRTKRNKTPTANKTRINVTPTTDYSTTGTTQISTDLATSSERPWRSFRMQTTINHSNNGLLNTVILIVHVLYFFQSCRLSSSGSNSRFHSKCSQRRRPIQASEWRFRLQKRPDFTRKNMSGGVDSKLFNYATIF
jgi:hypothetical protein